MKKTHFLKRSQMNKSFRKTSSACKKRGYPTKNKARSVRDIQRGETGTKLFIYACDVCNMYHLTRQSWGKNKRIV